MKRKDFSKLKLDIQSKKKDRFKQEDYIAGSPPFLRGNHSTMYLQNTLISKYTIENPSIKNCNIQIKDKIKEGYLEFILKFKSESNPNGIHIDTVDDMIKLLSDIPLNEVSITLNLNNKFNSTIIAFYLVATEELGFNYKNLKFSIDHSIENIISEKSILNSFQFINKNPFKFESICLFQNENIIYTNPESIVASLISEASNYFKACLNNGLSIDMICSKFSIAIELSKDYFYDISLIRATRLAWTKMMQSFNLSNQRSTGLQIHIYNSNSYLNTLTAVFGSAQSIISNKKNYCFIEKETLITKTTDPWGGSSHIEKLTENLALKIWELFLEIQQKEPVIKSNSLQKKINSSESENILSLTIEASKKRIKLGEISKIIENKE